MIINGRRIGAGEPPYIIAEIGAGHGGLLKRALEMIDAAKACGADAVKFQAYTANTITLDSDRPEFMIAGGPWKGKRLFDLYRKTGTPFEWFPHIKARAEKAGIAWLASCFDKTSVDLMVELDAAAIKIASFEIVDLPLVDYAASADKPLIISTGMASDQEIADACAAAYVGAPHNYGTVLLHCISGYPCPVDEANLDQMRWLKAQHFQSGVGISDHTTGIEIPVAATVLGACIIEKHFRLSWHPNTEDTPFSLDEIEFKHMVESVHRTWQALQASEAASEQAHRALRRSLFAVVEIAEGELFTDKNVRSIRPGHGLPPGDIEQVLGARAKRLVARGEPMSWDMVERDQPTSWDVV